MATISDASGQFIGSCFDDVVSADLEEAAASGACALFTVELDRRAGEETPRVTLKRVQPFDGMSGTIRLKVELEISDGAALPLLAAALADAHGGRGELIVTLPIPGGSAKVSLGRDFALDAEVAARVETVPGVLSVALSTADGPRLALVS
jgi:DNA polymerase III subunit alpha